MLKICNECGEAFKAQDTQETRCPVCGYTEYTGEPLERRRGGERCTCCPFTLEVCQFCEYSVPWDSEVIAEQFKPRMLDVAVHAPRLKQPVEPAVVVDADGNVPVYLCVIAKSFHAARGYKYTYKGTFGDVTHIFHEDTYIPPGYYKLSYEQWKKGTEVCIVECEECGATFEAIGTVGQTVDCPFCREKCIGS